MALKLSSSKSPFRNYILLAALTFFWGLNWPAMKLVLSEIPVWWFRSICLIGGAVGLMLISFFLGDPLGLADPVPVPVPPRVLLRGDPVRE